MSVLRISVDRAAGIASQAAKCGLTYQADDGELRDYIEIATCGDLDCVEMDIAVDLVRGKLLRIDMASRA